MSKEQIEEMENDLRYCHTEFVGDYADIYTDYHKTAEKLVVMGYRKQSEVIKEFAKEVKRFANGIDFKDSTEKTAFLEMLDDLVSVRTMGE